MKADFCPSSECVFCLCLNSNPINLSAFTSHLLFEAYPIHPPEKEEDPWKFNFKEDCGYKTKLAGGVYSVYKNEEDLANNKPIDYEVKQDLSNKSFTLLYVPVREPGNLRVGHAVDLRDDR